MGKSDGEFSEFFLIQNADAAPGHFDHALLGEVLEHSRYHFPGTSHIFGDLFMGEVDPGIAGLGELVQQEDGQQKYSIMQAVFQQLWKKLRNISILM